MNTLGRHIRLTTFGESHGPAMGFVLDGMPSNINIDLELWQQFISKRSPGQSQLTTDRKETDEMELLSGLYQGKTLGSPIAGVFRNKDVRSKDYEQMNQVFRPGHADFTWQKKYDHRDPRGGGRSSARETVNWTAAGGIVKQWIEKMGIQVHTWVSAVHQIQWHAGNQIPTDMDIYSSAVRCPDIKTSLEMEKCIEEAKKAGDTVGGCIEGVILGLPIGLGEPVFEKFHAKMAHAFFSLNAVKGVEWGDGFDSAKLKGSEYNDAWRKEGESWYTETNHAGGVLGGISNGMPVRFTLAFKPVSTIFLPQHTIGASGEVEEISFQGRHDPCVLPRAVPIVESLAWLTLADFILALQLNKIG